MDEKPNSSNLTRTKIKFDKFLAQHKDKKIVKFGKVILKIASLVFLLYIFMLSISMMGAAFKLFGNDFAKQLIATTSNPVVGLVIGVLATSAIQSSSTTTSIVVGLVGANALSIANAIPIAMGANIGTSVTNTLVSMGHITRSNEFERAFAASIVHDFFNVLTVLIFFPLQYFTNVIGKSAHFLADSFKHIGGVEAVSPIKLVTKPVVHFMIDKVNGSGIIVLILSLILLFLTLRYLVKVLKSLVIGKVEVFFDKVIFKNAFAGLLFGLILTAIVQSSSITTSLIVPLVGAGILTIEQIFPYTMGANIGTTVTAILASLATGNIAAITVAFAHLSFNIFGTIFFFPLRFIPISLAKALSHLSIKSKAYPILYVAIIFFIIPILIIYFL